ncbi:MAG: hypothetical protein M1521_03865 [Thermotogae bacterium]|nr:hypothetical protein [Thermotogota bacterium]
MIDILGGAFRDILFYGQVHAEDVIEMPGGTGYNVFAGLREIGIESVFHCAIGDDWPFENLRHVRGKSGIFVCRNETEILAVYRGVNLDPPVEEIKSKILFSTFECGGSTFEKYARAMKKLRWNGYPRSFPCFRMEKGIRRSLRSFDPQRK